MVDFTSILFVIAITALSLLGVHVLNIFLKIPLKSEKYQSISGLRGYLAFFVFIHHAILYYYFLRNNQWNIPDSRLFNHFGEISVVLFFMITSFLFTSKLLNQNIKIDWIQLFISRVLRIYPAFLVLCVFQILLIFFMSHFQFSEPPITVFKEIIIWLGFSIIDYLPINGYKDTNLMTANVLWTIRYEWVFYFALPILSLIISKNKPKIWLVLITSFIMVTIANHIKLQPVFIYAFVGGALAAILINNKYINQITNKTITSLLILGCLAIVVVCFDTSYSIAPICILTLAFIGIAGGNNLFGILTLKTSRLLGQLSYSMYLLHGIVLYFVFIIVLSPEKASHLSLTEHWLLVAACGLFTILVASLCFKWIESPCIKSSNLISRKIKKMFDTTK